MKKTRNDKFAVFILSHGRPDNVKTLDTLKKLHYSGQYYIVIDNEDKTSNKYFENFGKENIIVFDKQDISKRYDTFENFNNREAVFFARNACFEIAEKLELDYFLELDDDYSTFSYRKEVNGLLTQKVKVHNLDKLFEYIIEFLKKSRAKAVALAQGGDFIGGVNSKVFQEKLSRKAMNTFFCETSNKFKFIGKINEDVNTYTTLGQRGNLFFTISDIMINQGITQSNQGGMTELYLESGTYVKSFYSIISSPSCVKISMMGNRDKRMHHKIKWNNCTPKILSEKYKKKAR